MGIRREYFMRENFRREIRHEKVRQNGPFYTTSAFQEIFISADKSSISGGYEHDCRYSIQNRQKSKVVNISYKLPLTNIL